MTEPFLIIQYPYDHIEIALCSQTKIVEQIRIHKFEAIKLLIPTISTLLAHQKLKIQDLICVGINQGPGPYNTLRSIIATINGFHFTHKTKFVECEALPLLLTPYTEPTIALLNAFSKRVYYGIKVNDKVTQGICPIADLPKILKEQGLIDTKLNCIGNGAVVYKNEIMELSPNLQIADEFPLFNNLQTLFEETHKQIKQKNMVTHYTSPLYFN
jgi:tRNA A37 threonylcarbamoyladenosine modification protein TsaB